MEMYVFTDYQKELKKMKELKFLTCLQGFLCVSGTVLTFDNYINMISMIGVGRQEPLLKINHCSYECNK